MKLDQPTGSYYGGKTAAPVFRAILEAALAARDASLDRGVLAADRRVSATSSALAVAPEIPDADTADTPDAARVPSATVPIDRPLSHAVAALATTAVVPDVRGWTLRGAVHALHRAGLEVELKNGPRGLTDPAAGSTVRTGTIVRLGDGS